ncbi:MAG: DUF3581 domain-containing protein [gamma proteobacterium symbiont of Taylorina sp.]|nr:DUF3581 domain-containing protein [gamma proteobacterium symbiont of Taylorina sp.]
MNISNYFNHDSHQISFTRRQASDFAKAVAGDFNPIHDEDAKRFCVPGDLLFAVFLSQYGISQTMKVEFTGMVVDSVNLLFPESISESFTIKGDNDKNYMDVTLSGDQISEAGFIAALTEKYVQFSGQTFPQILVPLMQQENAMINPSRPLVIYKNMEIYLDNVSADHMSGENIELKLKNSLLQRNGKKGEVRLEFTILCDGNGIGHGAKNLLLSGLRDYDQGQLDEVINSYAQRKSNYLSR